MKNNISSKELQKDKILQALTVAKDINEASEIAKVTLKDNNRTFDFLSEMSSL